jgi:hypothetical protein
MKRIPTALLSGLFVLGLVGVGWAQQAPAPGQPQKPVTEKAPAAKPAAKLQQVTGSVKSASEESLVLEVPQKDKATKEYTFMLDPKAKLSKARKTIAVKDVQPGDSATVSFTESDGKLVAKAVTVRAKPAK